MPISWPNVIGSKETERRKLLASLRMPARKRYAPPPPPPPPPQGQSPYLKEQYSLGTSDRFTPTNLAQFQPPVGGLRPQPFEQPLGQMQQQPMGQTQKLDWRDKFSEIKAHPEELLPFAGELAQASRFALLYQTAQMIKDGKTPSPEALQELTDFAETAYSEKSVGYQIVDIVSQLPQFGVEILATLGTGGTAGVGAVGARGAALTAKQLLKSYISKAGVQSLKKLLVAGTIQAGKIGVARVPATTIEKQLMTTLSGNEEPLALSVVKAMGENWVEVVSERTGGLFGNLSNSAKGALIKKGLFKAFLKNNPNVPPSVMQQTLDKMQFHGVAGEWSEERIGDLMHGALAAVGLGDQPLTVPTMEQTIAELVAFSIPGAAMGIASGIPSAIEEARLRPERGSIGKPAQVIKVLPSAQDTQILKSAQALGQKAGLDVEAIGGISGGEYCVSISANPKIGDEYLKWMGSITKTNDELNALASQLGDRLTTHQRGILKAKKGGFLPFKNIQDAQKFLTTGDTSLIAREIRQRGEAWTPEKLAATREAAQADITRREQWLKPINQEQIDQLQAQVDALEPTIKAEEDIDKWKALREQRDALESQIRTQRPRCYGYTQSKR